METFSTSYDFPQGFLSAVPNLQPQPAGSQTPAQQGLCRQLCQLATFPPMGPRLARSTLLVVGIPCPGCHFPRQAELAALCNAMSPLLLGPRGTGTALPSPGGSMELMVKQMGICHCDTVGQTCCKPKSPSAGSWSWTADIQPSPSTMVNPTACFAGRLGTTDRHGKKQWDVRGCDHPLTPPPPQLLGK